MTSQSQGGWYKQINWIYKLPRIWDYYCSLSLNSLVTELQDLVNTLKPRQHVRHFADETFKRIFLNENVGISIKISLKFVYKGPFNNIPVLV